MAVLSLALTRAHLNISGNDHDIKLQAAIDAAEAVITQRCGPLTSTTVTARVKGGGYALFLPTAPALSLTSVTPVDGTALTVGDLYLHTGSGLVSYNSGAAFLESSYDVVYSAGRETVPPDLLMAAQELVRHMWETQRGPTRRPGSAPSEATPSSIPGAAHMLPYRVAELIAPHLLPPGCA